MPRPPGTPRAGRSAFERGAARHASLVASLLLAILVAPGCSSKPARKKGKSRAAATRQREERPLVDQAPAADPAAATAGGDDAPPVASAAPEPTADASQAEATERPTERPPPPAADPAPEASPTDAVSPPTALPSLGAPSGDETRPRSPLVDPDTAIPVDGGRIEVSSPLGWTRSPRSQNYLVRYQPGPRKSYPSIVVTAEPAPAGLAAVTEKTHADLLAAITAKLAVDFPAGGAVKVIKRPAAVTLGKHPGVAWAVPGSAKVDGLTETIDRFAWGVVLGGRLYVVEARAPRGKLDDAAKDRAKAVASTLFRPAGAPEGNPEGSAPAATAPTDE